MRRADLWAMVGALGPGPSCLVHAVYSGQGTGKEVRARRDSTGEQAHSSSMEGKLPEHYFELVREAVAAEPAARHGPKRRRTAAGVAAAESAGPGSVASDDEGSTQSEEEYDSEDFEDVEAETDAAGDVSVTLAASRARPARAKVVDSETRAFRRSFHMLHVAALLAHYHVRNTWLNDGRLQSRLAALVPDEVYASMHPERDEQLPLRSTRKLLDALRKCMKLWEKHCKRIIGRDGGLYMRPWAQLGQRYSSGAALLTRKAFNRALQKGAPMPRSVAQEGFVALLRGCGLNARLVASLQPPDLTDMKPAGDARGSDPPGDSEDDTDKYEFPLVWCEVWDRYSKAWITVDPLCKQLVEQVRNKSKLEPTGKFARFNQMRYVVGFDRKMGCRDITRRYCAQYNAKVRRRRITRDTHGAAWYDALLRALHQRKRMKTDDYEDEYFARRDEVEGIPNNMADLRNHPHYVLEKDLRQHEILRPGTEQCGYVRFKTTKRSAGSTLKVFRRTDIVPCYSGRHWFLQGKVLRKNCRAAKTVIVKDHRTGESEEERLYPESETEPYVPPPVAPDGTIPTNSFGNIDIYKPSMIPAGCVLIENPNAVRAAAFIGVPFAKAVTGFSFERGRTVKPKFSGVVVQSCYRDAVCAMIDGIETIGDEARMQERELGALQSWALLLAQLRVKQRLIDRHGAVSEHTSDSDSEPEASDTEAGGFFPDDSASPVPRSPPIRAPSEPVAEPAASPLQTAVELEDEFAEFIDELGSYSEHSNTD
ncbi:AGR162Cp [Eremothecium gossypii ATCC 10895]|uniref:AGR162Cp n=1 Tax=Eremothecium gossypii (strain ATCC 10895 / CBS 109.51 / FGSC 9923 / NRRL Y-1056) TaxID=284811 RepID=Q74ZN6_EREGS|nr:AGR162Cp [Eremothecium gossypii ATCC 10895]AAS54652.2 AGR162Cp [Eremothecium gossypii ATCC 10895]